MRFMYFCLMALIILWVVGVIGYTLNAILLHK